MATVLHRVGVRLTPEEYEQLQALAKEEDRSFNWIMRQALRQRYESRKPKRSYTRRVTKETA